MTDKEIQSLIKTPKEIKEKVPMKGYREENGYNRCDLQLESGGDKTKFFSIFVRQNSSFLENFSIGLRYQTKDKALGSITLVRYNGPHGEKNQSQDGHYSKPHIHYLTAEEMAKGNMQPQENRRELTDRYNTLEEALRFCFDDVAVVNHSDYFSELIQMRLFE